MSDIFPRPTYLETRLPTELLFNIVEHLDIRSLFRLQRICRAMHKLVKAILAFQEVIEHCTPILKILKRAKMLGYLSLNLIHHGLRDPSCTECGKPTNFLHVPTGERVCEACVISPEAKPRFKVVPHDLACDVLNFPAGTTFSPKECALLDLNNEIRQIESRVNIFERSYVSPPPWQPDPTEWVTVEALEKAISKQDADFRKQQAYAFLREHSSTLFYDTKPRGLRVLRQPLVLAEFTWLIGNKLTSLHACLGCSFMSCWDLSKKAFSDQFNFSNIVLAWNEDDFHPHIKTCENLRKLVAIALYYKHIFNTPCWASYTSDEFPSDRNPTLPPKNFVLAVDYIIDQAHKEGICEYGELDPEFGAPDREGLYITWHYSPKSPDGTEHEEKLVQEKAWCQKVLGL